MALRNPSSPPAILAGMLSLESDDTPMHIGLLLRFKLPVNSNTNFLAEIAAEFRRQNEPIAPWHSRLRRSPRLGVSWQPCAEVDLDHHFRQIGLPAPGGERELGVLVSRLHSQALDMRRPPWECYLIEGRGSEGFALYLKVHRALVDAAGGAEILWAFLDQSRRKASWCAPWASTIDSDDLNEAGGETTNSSGLLSSVADLGRAYGRLLGASLRKGAALTAPYRAPRSALNGPVNRQRRFATQQYDCQRIQALASAFDIGDEMVILLYLCGSALRRFLKEYNALPDEALIAAVPQSQIRLADFSLAFVSLGSDESDPLTRLRKVERSYASAQSHLSEVPPQLRMAYSLTATTPFIAAQATGLQSWLPAMFNVSVAPMPGPTSKRFLAGVELEAMHYLSVLTPGTALSIASSRYGDTINIGLTGARDTLPHLQRIAVYMGLALEQLEAVSVSQS